MTGPQGSHAHYCPLGPSACVFIFYIHAKDGCPVLRKVSWKVTLGFFLAWSRPEGEINASFQRPHSFWSITVFTASATQEKLIQNLFSFSLPGCEYFPTIISIYCFRAGCFNNKCFCQKKKKNSPCLFAFMGPLGVHGKTLISSEISVKTFHGLPLCASFLQPQRYNE